MAFFRRKKVDNSSDSQALMQQEEKIKQDDGLVETSLHFPEDWGISSKEKYIYQYHHKKLPKLKVGQISIAGIKYLEDNGEIVIVALIRNALPKSLKFKDIDLIVVDENNTPVAKKQFSLDHLGELPPFTSTPWRFLFLEEERLSDAVVSDKWKILFELKKSTKPVLDLEKSWEEKLTPEQKANLEGIIERLPKLGPDEVNIFGLELKFLGDQSLEATILIRNGTAQNIQLKQLPLSIEDASGELVCQGLFELPPLNIKAHSAKPWTFIFPAELILKQQPDLTKWKIFIKESNN